MFRQAIFDLITGKNQEVFQHSVLSTIDAVGFANRSATALLARRRFWFTIRKEGRTVVLIDECNDVPSM
nr:hypothetical protein CFP56_20321 [Quercus suber]